MPWMRDACGGWKNMDQRNEPGDEPCRCLTLAEALALDPFELEWRSKEGSPWYRMHDNVTFSLGVLRAGQFRRAHPKRSRVQEMADRLTHLTIEQQTFYCQGGLDAIHAACEYLKSRQDGWRAVDIERYFVEPR